MLFWFSLRFLPHPHLFHFMCNKSFGNADPPQEKAIRPSKGKGTLSPPPYRKLGSFPAGDVGSEWYP